MDMMMKGGSRRPQSVSPGTVMRGKKTPSPKNLIGTGSGRKTQSGPPSPSPPSPPIRSSVHEPIRFGTLAGPSSFGVGSISTTSAFAPRPFNSFIGKGNKNTRTRHPIPSSFVSSRERPATNSAFARTPPWQAENETEDDELELSGSSNQEVPDAGRCAPDCIEMLKGEGPDTMLSLDEQIRPLRVQADRPDGNQRGSSPQSNGSMEFGALLEKLPHVAPVSKVPGGAPDSDRSSTSGTTPRTYCDSPDLSKAAALFSPRSDGSSAFEPPSPRAPGSSPPSLGHSRSVPTLNTKKSGFTALLPKIN